MVGKKEVIKKEEDKGYTNKVEFTRFETMRLIQQSLSPTQISEYRHVSRNAVYKVLKTLKNKGLVNSPKRGIYELTPNGMKGLHSFVALRYNLRQHNLHFKIKVLESPRNWQLKRNEIRTMPYFNKTIRLKNNEQDIINFGRLQFKTTSQSVIIKMPILYAVNWEDALIQAMQILEDSIYKIENLLKIKLLKDYKSNIKIICQEYAILQDTLAKLYRTEGNRVYITGEDGKIWMITDFSFSVDETEFIHSNNATDDVDAIAPFMNDLRKNPTTLSNIREETVKVLEVAKAQGQNIIKHQSVLDEILITFKKLNERLDRAGL